MAPSTIKDIERAIETLSPKEIEELHIWLYKRYPQAMDVHLPSDLAAGRLDSAIDRALDDEKHRRVRPL